MVASNPGEGVSGVKGTNRREGKGGRWWRNGGKCGGGVEGRRDWLMGRPRCG